MGIEKAQIRNLDAGETYRVQFNPEQYTVNRSNNFSQVAVQGLSSPLLQFSHGEMQTLQMELFFDSREQHMYREAQAQAGQAPGQAGSEPGAAGRASGPKEGEVVDAEFEDLGEKK